MTSRICRGDSIVDASAVACAANRLNNFVDHAFRSSGRLYALFFLLIAALKWPFASVPPVWDEAFSIFPAADFLVKHGFDYSLLLSQPRYHEGGPTAHALSLLTPVTALVLKMTGGGTWAWFILHVSQWLMAAGIGTMLARASRRLFDEVPAFLLALATLAYPLMLAQLGGMYVEVPLLFFSLLAFHHYRNQRMGMASLFLVAACTTKASGVIALGTLALSALCSQRGEPVGKRFMNAFVLAGPASVVVLALSAIPADEFSFSAVYRIPDILNILISRNLAVYRNYISLIPELIVIVAMGIIVSTSLLSRGMYRYGKDGEKMNDIIMYNCFFILLFSLFHFVAYAYVQASDSHFLTRYFFFVIPSLFLVLYHALDKIVKSKKIKILLLLIVMGICLINRHGILYPAIPYSSIAMAERSEEYIDGLKVQKEYAGMIEKEIPGSVPIYVALPDYFFMHYAVSQYVSKPLPNVHYIGHVLKSAENGFKYPDHFVVVYSYPWLGGDYIKKMMADIYRRKEFSVDVPGYFNKGYFSAFVFEVKKTRPSPGGSR